VETERLRLERWDVDAHTELLVAMNSNREVMRFVGGGLAASRAGSDEQSRRIAAHWDRYGFGLWAVRELASGAPAGFAGLSHPLWFPAEAEMVEVGWRLDRRAWGQGFATEAGRAAIEAGFDVVALSTLVSYIHPDNARSQAVARRLGLELERTVRHPSRAHDLEVWRLDASPPAGGAC
jgi:RimJ/RimL family protein N-acetyltransferase